jgi:hypothetical protein
MVAKFFSKKLLAFLLTSILDVLVAGGYIHTDLKPLLMQLLTAIGGVYIAAQAVIDTVKKSA